MKTLIDTTTKESKYIWPDNVIVTVTSNNVITNDFIISDMNSSNSKLIENITVPSDWVVGKYVYNNGFSYSQKYLDKVKANALSECLKNRAAEYPPMTDYLDGIVKGNQAQVQAYIDACLAVKAKYPKPE